MSFKIDSILVFTLDWETLYCPTVSCANFFEHTNSDSCYTIREESKINEIIGLINKLERINTARIDVRCKMFFFSSDSIAFTACAGNNGTLFDGVFYGRSEELKNTILNCGEMNKSTFQSEKRNDYIEYGYKKLLRRIKKTCKYTTNKPIFIKGVCFANTKGKTIKAELIGDKAIIPMQIIKKIENAFRRYVIWNTNKERMSSDIIPIQIEINRN